MLSVRALSKAKFVKCPGYVDEDTGCDHDEGRFVPVGTRGHEAGLLRPRKRGRSFSFEVRYSEYSQFFDELYTMVYGVDAAGVSRKFRRHRGKPFIEFLDVPSLSQGDTIGPQTCAKLYGDFVAFAPAARKYFAQKDIRLRNFPHYTAGALLWDTYRNFRKAFKIASDHGFVCYW